MKRRDEGKFILLVVSIGLVVLVALYLFLTGSIGGRVEEGVYVGMRASDFTVVGIDGSKFRLSEHRGKIIILEFTTMWCPYCIEQIETLRRLIDELNERIYIVSIDVDPTEQPTVDWVRMMGIRWFYGHSPEAGLTYKISYVPTVIVIDRKGIIRYRGAYTPYEKLRSIIQQIGG